MKQNRFLCVKVKGKEEREELGCLDPLKGRPIIIGNPSTELRLLKSVRHLWNVMSLWKHVRTKLQQEPSLYSIELFFVLLHARQCATYRNKPLCTVSMVFNTELS